MKEPIKPTVTITLDDTVLIKGIDPNILVKVLGFTFHLSSYVGDLHRLTNNLEPTNAQEQEQKEHLTQTVQVYENYLTTLGHLYAGVLNALTEGDPDGCKKTN